MPFPAICMFSHMLKPRIQGMESANTNKMFITAILRLESFVSSGLGTIQECIDRIKEYEAWDKNDCCYVEGSYEVYDMLDENVVVP